MAVSIELRKPAVADNRNMRRRVGAGLLVAAASVTLAGVALQVSGGSHKATQFGPVSEQRYVFDAGDHGYTTSGPVSDQRYVFDPGDHGYTTDTAPITEQRIEFLQDNGFMPTKSEELARSIVAANAAFVPTRAPGSDGLSSDVQGGSTELSAPSWNKGLRLN